MKKFTSLVLIITLLSISICGCNSKTDNPDITSSLDPDNPVSLTVWHYYNGTQQATFDTLLDEFNSTVGKEKGIYIKAYSHGSIEDLEDAITSSLKGDIGAEPLPDIFSSYADTAYKVQKQGKLTDLTGYFSKEELDSYVDNYIQEGYFNDDGALYLFPVAKSTEIMMINKTDWEKFAQETNSSIDELSTTEGITAVAERYYNWTDAKTPDIPDDGKAFYGRDSMANYIVIGMKQMGTDIFENKDGKVVFHTDKKLLRRLWDNYYVPYVKGYFSSYGRFRSDDVKTGEILAYTGSMSSTFYFPDQVENGEDEYRIDFIVQNAPVMEGGENVKVQQDAGMAVTRSTEEKEYAACVFLKWFTQKENNLKFVCNSAYLPVLKEANSTKALDEVILKNNIEMNEKAYKCLEKVLDNFKATTFYTTKNVKNGNSVREVLNTHLTDRAQTDKNEIDKAVSSGKSRKQVLKQYLSDEAFDRWYDDFCKSLKKAGSKE